MAAEGKQGSESNRSVVEVHLSETVIAHGLAVLPATDGSKIRINRPLSFSGSILSAKPLSRVLILGAYRVASNGRLVTAGSARLSVTQISPFQYSYTCDFEGFQHQGFYVLRLRDRDQMLDETTVTIGQ